MATRTEKIRELLTRADAIGAKAQDEGREFTDTERAEVTDLFTRAQALKADGALLKGLAEFGADITGGDDTAPTIKAHSVGDRFVSSEQWKAFVAQNPGGFEGKKGLSSQPVGFHGLKDLVTGVSDTSAGALVPTDFRGLQDPGAYARPLTVFDLITRGQTGSDLVEYVRVTSTTNAAAPVPEAEISSAVPDPDVGNTAGVKPESALAMVRVQAPVVTIAHWIPATKRALSDATQVRTLIDNFLAYGLSETLETQIVTGSGGDAFTGILSTSGRQAQAWDTDLLTTTRKAKTKVRVVGRSTATAYVLHPNDAERLDLLVDTTGRFYFGGPGEGGVQRLWRLPVVESEAVPEGTGLLGDWRQAVLWDREQAGISVSDSHADFFTRNLVAILAELRAAFGIFRPAAFVEIDLTAGS